MLLQSHEGFLRLFPVIRHNESAAFEDLRANGAFLVSATFDPSTAAAGHTQLRDGGDGTVHGVRVKSEVKLATAKPGVFSFPTVAGAQYAISPPAAGRRPKVDDDEAMAKPPPKPAPSGPMFHFDCTDPSVPKGAKFCDHTLDVDSRVDDILSRIEASRPDGHGFFSMLETAWGSNLELGIPAHNVRLEALHGMGGTGCWNFGNGTTRCPTIFPGGGSLGASFNRTNW